MDFLFEAAVAGGIPIIRPLKQCLAGNHMSEVMEMCIRDSIRVGEVDDDHIIFLRFDCCNKLLANFRSAHLWPVSYTHLDAQKSCFA